MNICIMVVRIRMVFPSWIRNSADLEIEPDAELPFRKNGF